MDLREPIELLNELKSQGKIPIPSFMEFYTIYVETINVQALQPNGYILVAVKINQLEEKENDTKTISIT